tara:strand:- start:1947 stop:4772 length:2826 start_codon:yes stop_codon:yes gene_type:complete
MQTETLNGADGALSAVIAMLWVFGLMACVVVTFAANRREQTMLTQVGNNDLRMRVGVEIEVLRNAHAEDAPNHSIANWLDLMRSKHGDKFVEEYLATLKRRASEYRKTRQQRRAALRQNLPAAFKANSGWAIQQEGWSSGNTARYTKVTSDGSLNSGGFEVVSHPLLDGAHHGWLARVGTLLRHITRIDRSCGLHVHIGLRDPHTHFGDEGQMSRNAAKAIAGRCAWAYTYFGDVLNQFVSASRASATYCQPARHLMSTFADPKVSLHSVENTHRMEVDENDFDTNYEAEQMTTLTDGLAQRYHFRYVALDEDDLSQGYMRTKSLILKGDELGVQIYEQAANYGRYFHCNVNSLLNRGFGTVEYRQHQGTANPVKISYWIELMYQFTLASASLPNFESIMSYPKTREGMWAWLDVASDDPIVDYYTKRASVLSGSPLIRNCPACGSNTCVHYECAGANDPDVQASLMDGLNTVQSWSCSDCGDELCNSNIDDNNAYCENCEEHVRVTPTYSMGLLSTFALGLFVTAPLVGAVALLVGCGIGAMHTGTKRFTAKNNFKKLWSGLASRGGQAAGFAWQKRSQEIVWHLKAPTSSVYLQAKVNKHLSKDTVWTMAHTRFATHGKNDASNAHPHFGPDAEVTMVHNGVVHNHDDAWAALKIEPTGPVDSQAVAACLEVGGIEKVVELCEGSMSLIWSDCRDPKGTLKFWTNGGNPLCFGRIDNANDGTLVVASTLDHLEDSQGKRLKTSWSCTIGREYTVHPDGSITHRDIPGSADTAYGAYSWRTWATDSKTFKTKVKTVKSKKPVGKASGTADNCAVTFGEARERPTGWSYNFDDLVLNDALHEAWAANNISGFPSIDEFHGYNADTHSGIRPDKTQYYLPHYYGMEALDPSFNTDQQVRLMCGDFDPQRVNLHKSLTLDTDPEFDWPEEWASHDGDLERFGL